MFGIFKAKSSAKKNDSTCETVTVSGIVARCGVYMVPLGGAFSATQATIFLEGQKEPFWANATEVAALTKPGDEVTLVAEVTPETEGERRFAFEIANHTLERDVPSLW